MREKDRIRAINTMRRRKGITPLEWFSLYKETYDKISLDVYKNLVVKGIRTLDREETDAICTMKFFQIYYNFITDRLNVEFPPNGHYYYTACRNECLASIIGYGSSGVMFELIDPETGFDGLGTLVPSRERDEDAIDILEWYLKGLDGPEMGRWIFKCRKTSIYRRIEQAIQNLADRDGIDAKELKLQFRKIHIKNRKLLSKRMRRYHMRPPRKRDRIQGVKTIEEIMKIVKEEGVPAITHEEALIYEWWETLTKEEQDQITGETR